MTQTNRLLGLLDVLRRVRADLEDFRLSFPDLHDQFVGTQEIVERAISNIEKVNE